MPRPECDGRGRPCRQTPRAASGRWPPPCPTQPELWEGGCRGPGTCCSAWPPRVRPPCPRWRLPALMPLTGCWPQHRRLRACFCRRAQSRAGLQLLVGGRMGLQAPPQRRPPLWLGGGAGTCSLAWAQPEAAQCLRWAVRGRESLRLQQVSLCPLLHVGLSGGTQLGCRLPGLTPLSLHPGIFGR